MREGAPRIQADLAAAAAMLRGLLAAVDPAWVTAAAAAAGVLVALVTAITGLRSLRQLRIDSRERSRPMMAAELRKPPHTEAVQELVIRNFGGSLARNVVVTFDPPLPNPTPNRQSGRISPFIVRRYASPIPVITPGMELPNIWFYGRMEGNDWVNIDPMPDQFTVTIAYDGPDGRRRKGPRYEDQFPLNTNLIRQDTNVTSSGDPAHQTNKIRESLAKIEKSVASIARTIKPPATGGQRQQSVTTRPGRGAVPELVPEPIPLLHK